MIGAILSLYSPHYPSVLVYMLQSTEYQVWPYLRWYWRTQNFSRVERRGTLSRTTSARTLLFLVRAGIVLELGLGLGLLYLWYLTQAPGLWCFGLVLIFGYPIIWAHALILVHWLGKALVHAPRGHRRIKAAEEIFRNHPAEKIAIVGSYGKTSMKELLLTTLGSVKKVAATPANKNVAISHAAFAQSLAGDEDILIIEYGEGRPGDVRRFARLTHPNRAVITGVAAAHLDHYPSTEAAGADIFSVAEFISDPGHVYVNTEAKAAKQFIRPVFTPYDHSGALGWKVDHVTVALEGLDFRISKHGQQLSLHSGLLGRHNIGPLSFAAALMLEYGASKTAVQAAIAKTMPFEHRMQAYPLNGGWVIDDTYNGNIEGIRAGTELLRELPAKRKLYVTPGLVDQGRESRAIHEEMGKLIARSGASTVVLMQNSVTAYIRTGLDTAGFKGELRYESDPLNFYTNLKLHMAAGDLIMLQNDWPDNYY